MNDDRFLTLTDFNGSSYRHRSLHSCCASACCWLTSCRLVSLHSPASQREKKKRDSKVSGLQTTLSPAFCWARWWNFTYQGHSPNSANIRSSKVQNPNLTAARIPKISPSSTSRTNNRRILSSLLKQNSACPEHILNSPVRQFCNSYMRYLRTV